NLSRCAVTDRYAIIRVRFADAATRWSAGTLALVLRDPRDGRNDLTGALKAAAPLIAPDGLLVIEHARRDEAPADVASITKLRDIFSGDSALSLYGVRAGAESAGAI